MLLKNHKCHYYVAMRIADDPFGKYTKVWEILYVIFHCSQ